MQTARSIRSELRIWLGHIEAMWESDRIAAQIDHWNSRANKTPLVRLLERGCVRILVDRQLNGEPEWSYDDASDETTGDEWKGGAE